MTRTRTSLYDLIGPQQQRLRDGEAEGLGSLEIDVRCSIQLSYGRVS